VKKGHRLQLTKIKNGVKALAETLHMALRGLKWFMADIIR
jgi:hypothetical protein